MTAEPSSTDRVASARRITEAVVRRAAVNEGVGVLQCWSGGDSRQARQELYDRHGVGGPEAEAVRVAAVVDADANGRADPEWD